MSRIVKIFPVGTLNYGKCLKLQKLLSDDVKTGRESDSLIIVEHNPVYTVGLREKCYTLEEEKRLIELGAEFYRVDRGGLITFHGPGQLVVYPILDLRNYNVNVRCYVKRLEDTIIDLCRRYSLNAETSPHTGVWVNDMKICSLGIRVSRHVTTHGLALNCSTDLNWFKHVVPCGIAGKEVTSLSRELNCLVTVEETIPKFRDSFQKIFTAELTDATGDELSTLLERLHQSQMNSLS